MQVVPCTGSSDCASDQVCCLGYSAVFGVTVPGSQTCVSTACPSTEYQLCNASTDCAAGEVCQTLGLSRFQVCGLVDGGIGDGAAGAEGGMDSGGAPDSGAPAGDAASLPDVLDAADGGIDGADR